jgi:hypothetical protein
MTEQVFLAIDIETCGIDRSIFSIGGVLFKIVEKQMTILDEKSFSYTPILPTVENIDGEYGQEEHIKYNDFTIDLWDKYWSKNTERLNTICLNAKYTSEKEVLDGFYLWWINTTKKNHKLRIISDNVSFDIGYTNTRILKNRAEGSSKKPLNYQWSGHNWKNVLPIDIFSIEHIILSGVNGDQCLESIYNNCPVKADDNPIDNAKKIGWQYTQLINYF